MTDETRELHPDQPAQPAHPDLTGQHDQPAPRSWAAGVHPVNILHLVFGVAFLGLVVNWALIESGTVGVHGLRWLLPIPWVAAGAAGLIATAPRLRSR